MADVNISIDDPSKDFVEHLSLENNNRILFSGRFGIGKTTFINKFFNERKDYKPLYLRPVNYTVTSNEDIFKLIKYDILYHLMQTEYIKVDDYGEFSNSETLPQFFSTLALADIAPLIEGFGKIGATISKIALTLEKLQKNYNVFKEQANTNQDLKEIEDFLKKTKESHFLLEQDFVTDVIINAINLINEEKESRGAVLIIDDLDRIDPEHIFRLFNVFSTHFDYSDESKNKFDFHKIIFVCDVVNIKSIFKCKYGLDTDFNGYIDKFYSVKIFNYNNRKAITEFINSYVQYNQLINSLDPLDHSFLIDILSEMMSKGLINLRNLKKIIPKKEKGDSIINISSIRKLGIGRLPFSSIYLILTHLIGDDTALISILNKCVEQASNEKYSGLTPEKEFRFFKTYFLPLLDYNPDGFEENKQFKYKTGITSIDYLLKSNTNDTRIIAEVHTSSVFPTGTIWKWMLETIEVLKKEMR
ncbi:MAG: P-loop NTPase fold protein [Bacteroidia bacterium]